MGALMASASNGLADPPDFSEPWKFSDVVLVVEDRRFHVHRNILALWSPVFEKMFTSEFQEKGKHEIPLPGKKANEIEEFLLMIYPNVTGKAWIAITQENCHFLARLAQEYHSDAIFQQCEEFLVNKILRKEPDVLNELIFAQSYKLEELVLTSVREATHLSLQELNGHELYDQIETENYRKIVEGIVGRLETELKKARLEEEKIKNVKEKCLKEIFELTEFLNDHASKKTNKRYVGVSGLDEYLFVLKQDINEHYCQGRTVCPSLSAASDRLNSLRHALESLP